MSICLATTCQKTPLPLSLALSPLSIAPLPSSPPTPPDFSAPVPCPREWSNRRTPPLLFLPHAPLSLAQPALSCSEARAATACAVARCAWRRGELMNRRGFVLAGVVSRGTNAAPLMLAFSFARSVEACLFLLCALASASLPLLLMVWW